jgi:hypothetical protein
VGWSDFHRGLWKVLRALARLEMLFFFFGPIDARVRLGLSIFVRSITTSNRNMVSIKTGRKLLKTGDRGCF